MQINQKFRVNGHFSCSKDLSENTVEEFFTKLEEIMNEYQVYEVGANLNPYDIGVSIKKK